MKKYFSGLTKSTFLLALTSLFGDVSTEMLYPILPIFITQTLGASPGVIGLIEGIAPAVQSIVQGVSGWLSDRLQRRKSIALVGYGVAAIAKPLIGLSTVWTGVLAARCLDRIGAGTRSAPRDALVAASADAAHRGKAFGLEGFGDNLGAFLGPLIAIGLLTLLHVQLRSIFLLAFIPGALAALIMLFVREKHVTMPAKEKLDLHIRDASKSYWAYIFATAVFGIGNSTNAFLILRTQSLGVSLTVTILTYACFNLVAALASYPAGYLSDAWGRKNVLLLGFAIFFFVYLSFGFVTNTRVLVILFVFYGLYQGIVRAAGKALATDFVPAQRRASGVGWYTATTGLTGLVGSLVGGELWTRVSPSATFLYGAIFAVLGSIALMLLVPRPAAVGTHSR